MTCIARPIKAIAMQRSDDEASPRPESRLDGLRVLVVEDDYLVAMLLVDALEDLGCRVVGPFGSVSRALEGLEARTFDVALVDINLQGEKATPVMERLSQLGYPFAIASGTGAEHDEPAPMPRLEKPFRVSDVEHVLHALLSRTDM